MNKTWKRPERDQKETWKRGKAKEKSQIGRFGGFSSFFLRVFRLLSLLRRSVRTRMTRTDSGGRQSFPTVRNAGGCAKIWLNIMVKIYKTSGWWILYMTEVILGAGLICAFLRQLPRPKCTNSPRVKYSKSGLKPNRTFNTKLIKELFGFVAEAA